MKENDINCASLHKAVRQFAKEYNVGTQGFMHLMAMEEGRLVPGITAFRTDLHEPIEGRLGAVVCNVGYT